MARPHIRPERRRPRKSRAVTLTADDGRCKVVMTARVTEYNDLSLTADERRYARQRLATVMFSAVRETPYTSFGIHNIKVTGV